MATVTSHKSQDAEPTANRLLLNPRKSLSLFGPRVEAPRKKKMTAKTNNPIPVHFNIRCAAIDESPDVLSGAMLLMSALSFHEDYSSSALFLHGFGINSRLPRFT
jgi:hypothetical protein